MKKVDIVTTASLLAILVLSYFFMLSIGLQNMLASSVFSTFIDAICVIIFLRATLYIMDLVIGLDFKEWLDAASTSDKALYLSVRFLAVAIMLGLVIG